MTPIEQAAFEQAFPDAKAYRSRATQTGYTEPWALAFTAWQAALASLEAAKQEPLTGWKLVPVEATNDMTIAGVQRARRDEANLYRHEVAAIYDAMLAAAPSPGSGT